jgi:hypothetical protein
MEEKQFSYTIGDKKYVQRKLKLGQMLLLSQLLENVSVNPDMNVQSFIRALGSSITEALAIVLTPEGSKVIDKDDEEKRRQLAKEISFNVDPDIVFEVVNDFFDCNPIASLLEKLTGMWEKAKGKLGIRAEETKPKEGPTSKESSSSSPEATLQGGKPSSGDTPSTSAGPT